MFKTCFLFTVYAKKEISSYMMVIPHFLCMVTTQPCYDSRRPVVVR